MGLDVAGIGSAFDFLSKAADKIWPDAGERDRAKLAMFQAQQAGEFKELDQAFELAKSQIGVNAVEAASPSLFVSGARPAILWMCGAALGYSAIVEPIARFVATVMYHYAGTFPVIDTGITMQLLFGLLGLGAMRSYEKARGVA